MAQKSSYEHRRESWGSAQRPNIERDLNWQRLTDNNLLTLKVKVFMVWEFQVKNIKMNNHHKSAKHCNS